MYSRSELQKELSATHLLEIIKIKFQDFRMESQNQMKDEYTPSPSRAWTYYPFAHSKFCKKIYLETKKIFDDHQNDLSPADKMVVLENYIQLWKDINGHLDIQDTDFSERYKDTRFFKNRAPYDPRVPMFAGFNLKNIAFRNFFGSDMIFPSVNFENADFTQTQLPYTSFNDCNFTGSKVEKANFNQNSYVRCNFESVDFSNAHLCEVRFEQCIMYEAKYNKNAKLWINKCFKDNLLTAIRDGKLTEAMRLVETFPDLVHSKDVVGNTPLHLAVIKGQVEVIEFLLNNGARIDAVNDAGANPFCGSLLCVPPFYDHYSLETFERIVKLFIKAGVDLNETAHISKSYLGNLAFSGALEACKILVANGAYINIQDQFGYTPLHIASCGVKKGYFEKEQEEVAKWLVSIGANKNIKTNNGETALDFAEKFEHRGIVDLLRPNPPYPFFLHYLKVKPKQLTPEKVANALWLSDKDAKTTKISKSEFRLWASKQELHFNPDDVEKCLSTYVMKR
ncbi:hypothetical protein ELY21_13795 [Legionella sp. km535]|uniref:ankyrin repeat domain-containing protein n=1 Tax=Legionella sp. km535 TaxID=2498107 RepID=UPI000F8F5E13|nr:ankyrin repeat domain-containing protein [Legionella sp. km535]RUR16033.1 hypothetical protein ELY21_13795 [Legionella sp. km535]